MECQLPLVSVNESDLEEGDSINKRRESFRQKYGTDNPNAPYRTTNKTVFEKILQTPNSADDISWCCENGAYMYLVSFIDYNAD